MSVIRGSGPVAERLRAYVRARVHKEGTHYERGAALALAERLDKSPSWVSEYVAQPPAANADLDVALTICAFFGIDLQAFVDGPRLSRGGATIAELPKGGGPDVPAAAQRRDLREIATLKTRIARLEIALQKARDAARDIVRHAESVRQSRTPRKRRA